MKKILVCLMSNYWKAYLKKMKGNNDFTTFKGTMSCAMFRSKLEKFTQILGSSCNSVHKMSEIGHDCEAIIRMLTFKSLHSVSFDMAYET